MMKPATVFGIVLLSATVACGGGADENEAVDAVQETAPSQQEPTGTSGVEVAEPQPAAENMPQAEAALPNTASPLPLVGGIGALLVGGGIGLRWLRRR
jgi:hypothetical protein